MLHFTFVLIRAVTIPLVYNDLLSGWYRTEPTVGCYPWDQWRWGEGTTSALSSVLSEAQQGRLSSSRPWALGAVFNRSCLYHQGPSQITRWYRSMLIILRIPLVPDGVLDKSPVLSSDGPRTRGGILDIISIDWLLSPGAIESSE